MKEKKSTIDLKKIIVALRADVKKIVNDRKVPRLAKRNIVYNIPRLRSAESSRTDREVAVGQVLVVLKTLSEIHEISPERREYYRFLETQLNGILRDMSASPEVVQIQLALQDGNDKEKEIASHNLLGLSRFWRDGVANLIPTAFSSIETEDSTLRRNLAGFFYFVSSNNPALIEKYKLDFTTLASDKDPTVRGVSLMICLKTKDQKLLEKAYEMLQDNSSADLSYLNIPPQTIHFENVDMIARISSIAKEVVSVLGNEKSSGSNLLLRSFTVTLPTNTKQSVPAEIMVRADPVMDLMKIELDLSSLVPFFSIDSPKVLIGSLKAHEQREIPLRVVPTESGWVKSGLIITNEKISQEFPLETLVEESHVSKPVDKDAGESTITAGNNEAEQAPHDSVSADVTSGTENGYSKEICRKNLEILEMDIETRDGAKIVTSLKSILPCVTKDGEFYDQVMEIVDNINALSMFSTSVDDARYSMLRDLLRTARSIIG